MATPVAAWLSRIDLDAEIDGVPVSFDKTRHLSVIARKVLDGWLTELIGPTQVKTLSDELAARTEDTLESLTESTQSWLELVLPFLANASWARYVLHGNVNYTDTGPVSKVSDAAENITDRQRSDLSRDYFTEADRLALQLSEKARTSAGSCGPTVRSGRTNLTTVKGRRQSRFS